MLLIDGRSGSGKTELARAIVAGSPTAQLVRLDDLYPGWGGLEEGSRVVRDDILASDTPSWRRWDWELGRHAEWHDIDPSRPLVIEGCGALSRDNRRLATFGIWVALDAATRKRRALERDGSTYAPHWDEWAAQEDAFLTRENPAAHADAVIDGSDVTLELARWRAVVDAARVTE
ncbi:AAA family ATPase [Conyzicola nivalis]|uniref:Adenylate kinase n=1 Tax=Conyzicola nivalis TaxID=1477021 RepID=A0A916SHL7_9MICO|nr:adenylate kinase [Conyzicola nivalis]